MEFLIISGLSGAGKSRTMDILEDLDFYCVDNMPVALLSKFAELCLATRGRYERVALATDIRELGSPDELWQALDGLHALNCEYKILFLEADTPTIIKRYKETRRKHPLAPSGGSIEEAVLREISIMEGMRSRADYILNTTNMTVGMLHANIYKLFVGEKAGQSLSVNIISFGFKYGIPIESDLLFDVRFLPNPYYLAELREKNGTSSEVSDFVFSQESSREFMQRLTDMIDYLLPQYIEEGKATLTIGIGCTGGRHRSVAITEALADHIEAAGYTVRRIHRDVAKG